MVLEPVGIRLRVEKTRGCISESKDRPRAVQVGLHNIELLRGLELVLVQKLRRILIECKLKTSLIL